MYNIRAFDEAGLQSCHRDRVEYEVMTGKFSNPVKSQKITKPQVRSSYNILYSQVKTLYSSFLCKVESFEPSRCDIESQVTV